MDARLEQNKTTINKPTEMTVVNNKDGHMTDGRLNTSRSDNCASKLELISHSLQQHQSLGCTSCRQLGNCNPYSVCPIGVMSMASAGLWHMLPVPQPLDYRTQCHNTRIINDKMQRHVQTREPQILKTSASTEKVRLNFSIDGILGKRNHVEEEKNVETITSSSRSLIECCTKSSETTIETDRSLEETESDMSSRYSWLQCTRYRPPKLPRSKKKDSSKKRKLGRNPRVPFTQHQVSVLEQKFRQTHYLSSVDVAELSAALNLTETRVKIWFQNRRARERRDRDCGQNGSKLSKEIKTDSSSKHSSVYSLPHGPLSWPTPNLPHPGVLAQFTTASHRGGSAFTPVSFLNYS